MPPPHVLWTSLSVKKNMEPPLMCVYISQYFTNIFVYLCVIYNIYKYIYKYIYVYIIYMYI